MSWILRVVCIAGSVGLANAADADVEDTTASGASQQDQLVLDLRSLTTTEEISRRPVYLVSPEHDASRYRADEAYWKLNSPEYLKMERRIRNTRGGVIAGAITTFIGGFAMTAALIAYSNQPEPEGAKAEEQDNMLYTLSAVTAVGAVTMIATGILLGARKRKLRKLEERAVRFER